MSNKKFNYASCDYQDDKWFIAQVTEDGVWLRTPNDLMLPLTEDADLRVNASRAVFMADACNDALRKKRGDVLF